MHAEPLRGGIPMPCACASGMAATAVALLGVDVAAVDDDDDDVRNMCGGEEARGLAAVCVCA